MKLLFLGTTGYHPNDVRHTACLMLPEVGVVLDAGTGMYRVGRHATTNHLDVFLTHAHLDHVVGLTFLFDVVAERPFERITVHGEPSKLDAVREHLFHEDLFPVMPPCEFRPLADRVALPCDGRLTHFPLVHPGGALGYRLDWPDRSMAYVTDTTASADAAYVDRIRGVDLLVHECYFGDEMRQLALKTGHSHTTPVLELARAAEARQLLLVHVDPRSTAGDPIGLEAARSIFPAARIATDLLEVEF